MVMGLTAVQLDQMRFNGSCYGLACKQPARLPACPPCRLPSQMHSPRPLSFISAKVPP